MIRKKFQPIYVVMDRTQTRFIVSLLTNYANYSRKQENFDVPWKPLGSTSIINTRGNALKTLPTRLHRFVKTRKFQKHSSKLENKSRAYLTAPSQFLPFLDDTVRWVFPTEYFRQDLLSDFSIAKSLNPLKQTFSNASPTPMPHLLCRQHKNSSENSNSFRIVSNASKFLMYACCAARFQTHLLTQKLQNKFLMNAHTTK